MLTIAIGQVKMAILDMIFFDMARSMKVKATPRVAVDFIRQLKNPHI